MAAYEEERHTFIVQSNLIDPEFDENRVLIPGAKPGDPMYDRHLNAYEAAYDLLSSTVIPRTFALTVHRELTRGLELYERNEFSGAYRKHGVEVGGWSPPDGFMVPLLVEGRLHAKIIDYMANPRGHCKTKRRAWEIHNAYETIHPFADGNGRSGRCVMNGFMRANNRPILIVYNESKRDYIAHINRYRELHWANFKVGPQDINSLPV